MRGEIGRMTLGGRIAFLRGRRSQEEIAKVAGINHGTLSRIERGSKDGSNPGVKTLRAIARGLGVQYDDLWIGVETTQPLDEGPADAPAPAQLESHLGPIRNQIAGHDASILLLAQVMVHLHPELGAELGDILKIETPRAATTRRKPKEEKHA